MPGIMIIALLLWQCVALVCGTNTLTPWKSFRTVCLIREDGSIRGIGSSRFPPRDLQNVRDIYSSAGALAALTEGGEVHVWGNDMAGGKLPSTLSPLKGVKTVATTWYSMCALKEDTTVVCWGHNRLEEGAKEIVAPAGLSNVSNIIGGGSGYVAILYNGSYITWSIAGYRYPAQATATGALKSICGQWSTWTVLTVDGQVSTFGASDMGISSVSSQLAEADIKEIYCSQYATAALTASNELISWSNPGEESYQVNTTLPPEFVIKYVFASIGSWVVLSTSGDVRCSGNAEWGNNCTSGDGSNPSNVKSIYATRSAWAALHFDRTVTSWGHPCSYGNPQEQGDVEVPTGLENITYMVSNECSFCALTTNHTIEAFGRPNYGGEIPDYVPLRNIALITSTRYCFAALTFEAEAFLWGLGQAQYQTSDNVGHMIGSLLYRALSNHPLSYSLDEDLLAPFPTGIPSSLPTVWPTSQPTTQPTTRPTTNPTSMNRGFNRTWAHGAALDLQSFSTGEGLFFTGEYSFTNIGMPQLSQYSSDYSMLLTIDVYDSGFGPVRSGQFL